MRQESKNGRQGKRVSPGGRCVKQFRETNLSHNDDIHGICAGDIPSDFGKSGFHVGVGGEGDRTQGAIT